MQDLQDYCKPFSKADAIWPALPLPPDAIELWWRRWLLATAKDNQWQALRAELPQLLVPPQPLARLSDRYQRLVLRGESPQPKDLEVAPRLRDPKGFSITIANHPCGAKPVLSVSDHDDFVLIMRCLAHRCEPIPVQGTVHAQAVAGLIHWGLIRELDVKDRCQILILHRAPYSSLSASSIPGRPSLDQWIKQSQIWRLEHELAHIACRKLVGEMRINLFDELLADAIGMKTALGHFQAELFRQGLGLNLDGTIQDDARAHLYVQQLDPNDHVAACQMLLARANELEQMLNTKQLPSDSIKRLKSLTRSTLDQALKSNVKTPNTSRLSNKKPC